MKTDEPAGGLEVLADTLWAERHVVEMLLFKLVTARLLLAADERRFVGHALGEVERVVDALREAELLRAMAVESYAEQRGLAADDVSLGWLARNAPAPWQEVFADHRKAFLALAAEIDETTSDNRQLAHAGLNRIQDTIGVLTGPQATPESYDRRGRAARSALGPMRVSEAL